MEITLNELKKQGSITLLNKGNAVTIKLTHYGTDEDVLDLSFETEDKFAKNYIKNKNFGFEKQSVDLPNVYDTQCLSLKTDSEEEVEKAKERFNKIIDRAELMDAQAIADARSRFEDQLKNKTIGSTEGLLQSFADCEKGIIEDDAVSKFIKNNVEKHSEYARKIKEQREDTLNSKENLVLDYLDLQVKRKDAIEKVKDICENVMKSVDGAAIASSNYRTPWNIERFKCALDEIDAINNDINKVIKKLGGKWEEEKLEKKAVKDLYEEKIEKETPENLEKEISEKINKEVFGGLTPDEIKFHFNKVLEKLSEKENAKKNKLAKELADKLKEQNLEEGRICKLYSNIYDLAVQCEELARQKRENTSKIELFGELLKKNKKEMGPLGVSEEERRIKQLEEENEELDRNLRKVLKEMSKQNTYQSTNLCKIRENAERNCK